MAILMQDKIDAAKAAADKKAKDKRNELLEKSSHLADEIYKLKNDLQDILDTEIHLYRNGMKSDDFYRGVVYHEKYDKIAFEIFGNQMSVSFLRYIDYQRIIYSGGLITIKCVNCFNGREQKTIIYELNDFSTFNDYWLKEATLMMEGFISDFPTFKEKYMQRLESL